MKKQKITLVFLINLLFCISASEALASSPWNFGIDLSYEKTDKTQANAPAERDIDLKQEYRILHNVSLSLETRMATELRAELEREDRKGSPEADSVLSKPYADFQIKSRLYDLGIGYRGSDEKNNVTRNKDEGFVDFKLQPEYLPELNIKYDFTGEKKSGDPKTYVHNISVSSLYNVQEFLRIRLDYEGEVTDYQATPETTTLNGDTREGNFLGQVTLKHSLLSNKLRFSLDYKAEKESDKNQGQDPNVNIDQWVKVNDQFVQTTNSQITYTITPSTNLYLQYENKHTADKADTQNSTVGTEQKDSFRLDISQKIYSYLTALGKYRSEKNQNETQDEVADTYEAEMNTNPQDWLFLRGKVRTESRDIDGLEDDGLDKKEDTQTVEATWDAAFPQLLDAQNTFNVKLVKEKRDDVDSAREKHYKWRLQLTPIVNLKLTPEYDVSNEKEIIAIDDRVTREFRTDIDYAVDFSPHLKINLSHSLSRKRIEEEQLSKDNNGDTKVAIKFTPTQNLIFSSQIIRQDKKIFQNGDLIKDEVDTSYALNYDWRFDPVTWSSSFKYDDRNHKSDVTGGNGGSDIQLSNLGSDTETLESKLTYRIKQNYDLTMNYKYTKTYARDSGKEQRIGLQLRAYY